MDARPDDVPRSQMQAGNPVVAEMVHATTALSDAKIKHLRSKAAIAKTYQILHEYQRQEEQAKAALKEAETRVQVLIDKEFNQ